MELSKFLVKAKINTYANGGERETRILEDGSKELAYEENEFRYRDSYFGFNPFIGEEIVWQNGKVIWAMSYYGRITSEIVSVKQVYQFLRKAMRQVKEDRPFRGPNNFKEDDFEYIDESKGTIDSFVGAERIFYRREEIYRLNYHGGFIKIK